MIQVVENGEKYVVTVNGREITVRRRNSLSIDAECNLSDLAEETGVDFPEGLSIDIDIEDEFDSFPFRRVGLYRIDGPVLLEFECDDSDTYWENGPRMVAAIKKQLRYHDQFLVDGDEGVLYVRTVIDPAVPLSESITQAVGELSIVMAEAKVLDEAFRHR